MTAPLRVRDARGAGIGEYGERVAAVRGFPTPAGEVDLDVRRGEVVLLEGPNGCGKTSLLRALAGLDGPLAPRDVDVAGDDPRTLRAPALAARVALAPQRARDGLAGLTVRAEFALRGRAAPATLAPLAARASAALSSGEARRVVLALADGAAPLVLLDEPAEGLDAEGRAALRAAVAGAARRGAVVAVDHAGLLADLATRRVVLGGSARSGPAEALPAAGGAAVVEADAAVDAATGLRLPALALPAGFHVVEGPNGAGKSTLLARLSGAPPVAGVRVAGRPPRPGLDARLLPADAREALRGASLAEALDGCDAGVVGALVPPALLEAHPLACSGGEAQRAALARVLGRPAPLYLLDEPEAHLDADGRRALTEVVARRVRDGACVLAATHDPALVAAAGTRLVLGAPA